MADQRIVVGSIVSTFEKNSIPPLCLSQAFINLVCKDTKNLPLNLIVAEKKREEILVLLQALNQRIVNVIEIRKLKILDGIVPCACLQLVGLQQNIPNLQHRFDCHIVIIGFSRPAVDFGYDLGKPFLFCFGQAKTLRCGQLYNWLCYQLRIGMFLGFFLNEICSFDFAIQIIAAARMLNIDVCQQISNEIVLLMQVGMESSQKQKIILDECSRMSKLVQSMLALASSDAGNWKMDIRETDVDTLLIETWEKFSESARKKNIRLNLDIEDHYPKTHCDKERISQVLGILLDNAISYSSPGQTIEMGAKVLPQKLAFFVIDHGPGIADAEKERVFERFYSGDPSRTDKSHFGLGLSIAQEIVKLHHGTIRLADTPGGGCTFEICIQ